MIRKIKSLAACRDFVRGFYGDPQFSVPVPAREEPLENCLTKALENPERYRVLGAFRGVQMTGLFVFLALEEGRYLELLTGLSRDGDAYPALLEYLARNYPGWSADFVFHPGNELLKRQLRARSAEFDPEQQKMVLRAPVWGMDTTSVVPYSQQYAAQYFAIHNQDMYWTGAKVAAAPDRFRTLLAIHDGKVVGYIDVTHCFEENEPYDLYVLPEYRRMGYGRKLLASALERNRPNGMMLLVNVDNTPAIRLYQALGFQKTENENSQTVHWQIPEKALTPL